MLRCGPLLERHIPQQWTKKVAFAAANSPTFGRVIITLRTGRLSQVPINREPCSHAARSTRISISLRSAPKSIGLVRSPSAPLSSALRLVSGSP